MGTWGQYTVWPGTFWGSERFKKVLDGSEGSEGFWKDPEGCGTLKIRFWDKDGTKRVLEDSSTEYQEPF